MRKAVGRGTAEVKKSRKTAETKKTAGKRSSPKPALRRAFDPDTLLDSMDGMIYVASRDYRIEYMNEAALRKIGRDMTGRRCFKVFHGLEERCPWCMGELVLQGQTVRQEIQNQLDKRWYSSVLTPLYREDSSVSIQTLVFDITDQKQAQAALVQNEALLRSIHQAAPMGIGVVHDRVLDWTNEQLSRMTGYAADELRGKSARMFYPDDEEFDRVGRHKYAEIRSKETGSIVTVWRRKDGRLINVYLSSTPIDPGDLSVGVVFTALDITEKKKAQDELWKSEEKYRVLFENAVMGIFQSTPEGRFLSVNPATAKMCGYSSPEEMAAGVTDIANQHYVDPAERDLFIRAIEGQGFVRNFEHRTYRKDGSVFWVSVNAREVRDGRGKITYYEGTHEDIQWRKEAEERLRQSEGKYRQIIETCPIGIAICDLDGRFLDANRSYLEMTGYGLDALRGKRYDEITPSEYHETERNVFGMLNRSRTFTYDKECVREDGTRFPVSVTAWYAADAQGEKERLGAFVMDLSDRAQQEKARKELEGQLRQAQKMEAIGTLAGGIAHDFNNILFTIVGFTDLSLHDAGDGETRWNLTQVLNACDRAKNLVNQILAFSRQEAPERRPVDIVPVAKDALKFLRSTIPSTIELKQRITGGNLTVLSDPTTIHQVLINLGTNAAHAMRTTGGVMEVCLESLEIPRDRGSSVPADLKPGPYIRMTVRDTGLGIDPAIMNRIFDPFFTTKAQGEGTGLGLSVVYGIVKSHGGSIAIESEVGRGSTFHVYLPRTPEAEREDDRKKAPASGGSEHILFVDDEPVLVDMGERMLNALGYRVTAVSNGAEALATYRENPGDFDLVITDMTMPGMTGAELSREILKIDPGFPIILCTGFSEIISEGEAKAMGIRRFLMKPVFLDTLAGEIRTVLDTSRREVT